MGLMKEYLIDGNAEADSFTSQEIQFPISRS